MTIHQKNNHFTGCSNIGRKDKLWLHISSAKRKFNQEYSFVPNTYLMQYDYDKIKSVIQQSKQTDIFIMKPVASGFLFIILACGKGIKLINKKNKIIKNNNYLISEYIQNPHLINDLKYDLRIYVLVTSFDPLKIYTFNDGLCRFATEKYDLKKIKQRYSHLTNFSVNKNNSKFIYNQNSNDDGIGSKWSIQALKNYYLEQKIDSDTIFNQINDIIIKTLIAVEPFQIGGCHRNGNFELYGFDILIDDQLKPWLLEINVFPSLSSSSPMDKKIKYSLISDVCNLVGFYPYDQGKMFTNKENKKIYGKDTSKGPINCQNLIKDIQDLDFNNCLQKLSPAAWKTLFEFDEEFYRKGFLFYIQGQFERIFPNKENADQYQQFFQFQRFNNLLVQKYLNSPQNFLTQICEKINEIFV